MCHFSNYLHIPGTKFCQKKIAGIEAANTKEGGMFRAKDFVSL